MCLVFCVMDVYGCEALEFAVLVSDVVCGFLMFRCWFSFSLMIFAISFKDSIHFEKGKIVKGLEEDLNEIE